MIFFSFLGIDIVPEECNVTMGIIPDRKYPFSDHEGVAAIFSINQNAKCKYIVFLSCIENTDRGRRIG